MIYDCFTYYNELEILELRLHTLSDAVDYFLIVEADRTFSGKPRAFHFAANRDRFARFESQIIYVQVTDMPTSGNEWDRQYFQRNCILRGLAGCAPDDVVIVSDVDEIPHPDAVRNLLSEPEGRRLLERYPVAFAHRNDYYFVNCVMDWFMPGAVAVLYRNLTEPEMMRAIRLRAPRIREGGWHFTYLGGPERVLEKIEFLGHGKKPGSRGVKDNNIPTLDEIRASIEAGKSDVHNDDGDQYYYVSLDDTYPAYMPMLLEKYPYLRRDVEGLTRKSADVLAPQRRLFYNYPRWHWYLLKCRLRGRRPF